MAKLHQIVTEENYRGKGIPGINEALSENK